MVTKKNQCHNNINFNKFNELSKKWALVIIKDLFLGCKKFNDFLEINTNLSNKVLSDQLKRLEKYGFITKNIVSTIPLKAEYELTEMGKDLNKIIYEKFIFGIKYGFANENCPYFKGRKLEEIFNIKK
jgi:DNA-binding HxlR family transcriptional regulator